MPSQLLKLAYTIFFSLFLISPQLVYAADFGLSLGYWDLPDIGYAHSALLEPQGDQDHRHLFSMAQVEVGEFKLNLIPEDEQGTVYLIQTNEAKTQIRNMTWFNNNNRERTLRISGGWKTLNLLRVPAGGPTPDIWNIYHTWRLSPAGRGNVVFPGHNSGAPVKYPFQAL